MLRRLTFGGTVAVAVLLAVSSFTTPAWAQAQAAWACPAAENAKKNPVPKSDAAVAAERSTPWRRRAPPATVTRARGTGPAPPR